MIEQMQSDVLVIGGGGAGTRAAIEAHSQGASVILASKGPISRSGTTPQAWPSYEASFGFEDPRDGPEVHFEDTVREGRFLGDENLIWALASEAAQRALDLQSYGVRFEEKNGRFLQVHHPGQTYARNLVIKGGGALYYHAETVTDVNIFPVPYLSAANIFLFRDVVYGIQFFLCVYICLFDPVLLFRSFRKYKVFKV